MQCGWWRRGQHLSSEAACSLCSEVLQPPSKAAEASAKGGSLLSSISGAVKTATRAVKTAMTFDDSAESAAYVLRPWSHPQRRPPTARFVPSWEISNVLV